MVDHVLEAKENRQDKKSAANTKQSLRDNPEADRILDELGLRARNSIQILAASSVDARNQTLRAAAAAIRGKARDILDANQQDMDAGRQAGLASALIDRLALDPSRLEGIARGLESIADRPDPLNRVLDRRSLPNGLRVTKRSKPIGVIGIIFEARPNVAADAAGLTIKSGNACLLRPGSEALRSAQVIAACMRQGLKEAGLPVDAVLMLPDADRALAGALMRARKHVDVLIPRGGKNLVACVQEEAKMPVFAHLEGLCHTYVNAEADVAKAVDIIENAKMRRVSICGATETLLVDRAIAPTYLPLAAARLSERGCHLLGDEEARNICPEMEAASEADWVTEYLDAILAVRVVSGPEEAVDHIRTFGSGHTDAIITENASVAELFLREVDSAIVMHNVSTQYADGGEFGLGAEIGIATGRIHARGPVGADELTIYNWVVEGTGQCRP